jgi:phosphoribosylformylglycinamidine synthase
MTLDFKSKGDLVFVVGSCKNDINSSEYLSNILGIKESPAPYFNLEEEFDTHQIIKSLIQKDLINAAHDVSDGGLFTSLIEMAIPNELGFDIETDSEIREDAFLFGESQGRIVVTVGEDSEDEFIEYMATSGIDFTLLGHVTKGKIQIDGEHFGFINDAKTLYENALQKAINN